MTDLTELLREMAGRPCLALTLKERRCLREAADALARLRGVEAAARKMDEANISYFDGVPGSADPPAWRCAVCDQRWETQRNEPAAHEANCPVAILTAALSGSPPVRGDDAMLQRACAAHWNHIDPHATWAEVKQVSPGWQEVRRHEDRMFAALTAAIGGQNG